MAVPLRRDDPTGGAGPNDVTALDELPNYIEANGDCCSSRLRKSPSVPPVLRRHRAPMCAIRTCGCCPNLRRVASLCCCKFGRRRFVTIVTFIIPYAATSSWVLGV